jgi:hypothetical protein
MRFTLLTYGLVEKRAESSSFAIGRLEAMKGSTVTKMTLDHPIVTFRAIILFVANLPEKAALEGSILLARAVRDAASLAHCLANKLIPT